MSDYIYKENIYDFDGNAVGCVQHIVPDKIIEKIKADVIDDFAGYLEDMEYLNRVDIEYDYEENIYERVVGLTKKQVISEYLEEIKGDKNE